jgi:hypothetical protein
MYAQQGSQNQSNRPSHFQESKLFVFFSGFFAGKFLASRIADGAVAAVAVAHELAPADVYELGCVYIKFSLPAISTFGIQRQNSEFLPPEGHASLGVFATNGEERWARRWFSERLFGSKWVRPEQRPFRFYEIA